LLFFPLFFRCSHSRFFPVVVIPAFFPLLSFLFFLPVGVIPAKAGIPVKDHFTKKEIPAFAGMTGKNRTNTHFFKSTNKQINNKT